ncbi:MAG: GNAT family N-acetyltransferase [Minwuia sp.]|uniref:GNAT family N-acetyltransferase n=1 Tax=Minwuia sp. TaxID=2493630 RepID=UPI003A843BBE
MKAVPRPAQDTARIEIRKAPSGFDRWPEVHGLLMTSFAYMQGRIDPPSSMNRLTLSGLIAKSEVETALLAWRGEDLVGCAFCDARADCLYVGKVAVSDSARGAGIARALMTHAEDLARDRGLPFLELQTRVELVENHETFRRLGFVKTGEDAHEGYDRPTSIRMRKPVQPRAK